MSLTKQLYQLVGRRGGLDDLIAIYPRREARVRDAYAFYRKGWSGGKEADIVSQLAGIDFNFPVNAALTLDAGTLLASFRHPKISAFRGRYFSRYEDNAKPTQNGVSARATLRTMPKIRAKVKNLYEVVKPVPAGEALESISAPVVDNWSVEDIPEITRGGATQIFIPSPHLYVNPRHDPNFRLKDLKAALRAKHGE